MPGLIAKGHVMIRPAVRSIGAYALQRATEQRIERQGARDAHDATDLRYRNNSADLGSCACGGSASSILLPTSFCDWLACQAPGEAPFVQSVQGGSSTGPTVSLGRHGRVRRGAAKDARGSEVDTSCVGGHVRCDGETRPPAGANVPAGSTKGQPSECARPVMKRRRTSEPSCRGSSKYERTFEARAVSDERWPAGRPNSKAGGRAKRCARGKEGG